MVAMAQDDLGDTLYASFDKDRDTFCVACGYNLRGIKGSRCPECGERFYLASDRPRERYGLYLIAVMSTSVFVASNMNLLWWTIASIRGVIPFNTDPLAIASFALNLIAIPYLACLLIFRVRIIRAHLGARLGVSLPPAVLLVLSGVSGLWSAFTF